MEPRIVFMVLIGLGLMAAVGAERWLKQAPLPMPVPLAYVALGWLAFSLPAGLPRLDPVGNDAHALVTEYLTEFIVIASLMAAGLAIDRPLSWRGWSQVNRLIVVAMPLTVLLVGWLGWAWLGLAPATAILLAACLAPTDPVLANSVSVGPPGEGERDDVRFDLTVEAGINDGLAFPFTYLAIAAVGMTGIGGWTAEWFAVDVVWRILAGVAVGIAVGWAGAWYTLRLLPEGDLAEGESEYHGQTHEGVIVLGFLLAAYGLAEVIEGYGFLAVFAGAVAARQFDARNRYHRLSHHFIGQIEEIVLVAMLIGFGGLLAGGLLDALTWQGAVLGLGLILVIRPATAMLASIGGKLPWQGRLAVAFFGVRGMGSIYYLAYGQNKAEFAGLEAVWAITGFAILASLLIHGLTSNAVIGYLERNDLHVVPGAPDEEVEVRPASSS